MDDTTPFRVVFTCVDHRTRTYLAEHLLRHALGRAGVPGIEVEGAGGHRTRSAEDRCPTARQELLDRGIVPDIRPPAQFSHRHLMADLVITFEREHRVELYQYAPRMLTRCFTITELAAIVEAEPTIPQLPRADRVDRAHSLRSLGSSARDVPETWNRSADACRAAAQVIDTSVQTLATFFGQ